MKQMVFVMFLIAVGISTVFAGAVVGVGAAAALAGIAVNVFRWVTQ